MLKYHLIKLKEYLQLRISCFELFEKEKEKLKDKLILLNEILNNITSDKEIENCLLRIISYQIKILESLLKNPELEFESIIDGLTNIKKISKIFENDMDINKKISNISDDNNDLD